MKEEIVNEIIVTFADYVESYYDEKDQEALKGNPDPDLRDSIKKEVVQEFLMIVRVRTYTAIPG